MMDIYVALFDMDGTICDYVGSMKKELKKLMAPGEDFIDPYKLKDKPKYQYLWNRMELIKANEDWWANLPRYQLGFDVLDMTTELGYYNEILTQSPEENPAALAGKLRWILKNLDKHTDYTMTRNKSRYYGRVLVDDYPDFVVPWLKHRKNGLAIMPSNEYNHGFTHEQVVMYDGKNKDEVMDALIRAKNK